MKYEITDIQHPHNPEMRRIRALVAVGSLVAAGDLGGYVEKPENLSQDGNALVSGNAEVMWFSKVGSENGTLTAYYSKTKEIIVTRGCFIGTIDEFERKVKEVHAGKKTEKEYLILIDYIKTRFAE